MKFGQLIGYDVEILFFKNHAENEPGIQVSNPFSLFEKAL